MISINGFSNGLISQLYYIGKVLQIRKVRHDLNQNLKIKKMQIVNTLEFIFGVYLKFP